MSKGALKDLGKFLFLWALLFVPLLLVTECMYK